MREDRWSKVMTAIKWMMAIELALKVLILATVLGCP